MPTRNAARCTMTNAEALTARMPRGVMTPRARRTSSLALRLVAAAASLRAASVVAGVERMAAGAGVHGVRVVDREAGAHQAVDVVDLRASDVADAEVVDQDLDASVIDDDVVRPPLVVEGHAVLHARAAAAADEDAEGKLRVVLFGEQVPEAGRGFWGEGDDSLFDHGIDPTKDRQRRPSLNPFFSPLGSLAVEPAICCASCSTPREISLFGSVRTRISPLTAASSGLVPSKPMSIASSCLSVRTTSSLLTTDFGTLLLRARMTRPGTMLRTLVKMFSSSPTSLREESSGVTRTSTRWEWSRTLMTMSVKATPRSKTM